MDEPRPVTVPALLGVALGLLVVLSAAAMLLRPKDGELGPEAGREMLAERFGELATPDGFEVRGARKLAGGQLQVTLAAPGEAPAEPAPLPFEGNVAPKTKSKSMGGGRPGMGGMGGWDPKNRTEWDKLALREAGPGPVEVTFLFASKRKRAEALLDSQFGRARFKDIAHLRGEGEAVPIDSGRLDWGGFEATWVQLRHYQLTDDRVPTSHDTVRVNLTTGPEARVLYLRWPRTYPGGIEPVEAWLAALEPGA